MSEISSFARLEATPSVEGGHDDRPELSIILPLFNEEAVIDELHRRLSAFLQAVGASWEVLFINDGSTDASAARLADLCRSESRYRLVSFSRNFGHQIAITAGFDYARGDAVVVMDADLQDPPEVVAEMLVRYREGFDIVHAVRRKREKESLFKRFTAYAFYRLLRAVVGIALPVDAGDFRLVSRRVILTLRALRETNRFVRGMVAWVGFRQTTVLYDRKARFAGETHYPLRKMLKFAFDGITAFSIVPLRIATWLGTLAGFVGIGVAGWSVYGRLYGLVVPGWATIMITVSLGASAQLLMTGILGEYVGRIYEEVKRRPLYIVADEINVTRDATAKSSGAAEPG
ncbi:MAG TPA: glycosyltransferase family 2 protein [Polyangiaceae bacterium]|nr:glycosyltransferase family 2 protein [Polyangiaceae bacterium]